MSTSIEINGVNLIPIKEATSLVSYSKDYIARLAREGKIVGSQVGRQWYIDAKSLQNFAEVAALQEVVKTKILSDDRKSEIRAKERVDEMTTAAEAHDQNHKVEALTMSVATLCLGLLVGVGFYTTTNITLPEGVAVSDSQAGVFRTVDEQPIFISEEVTTITDLEPTTSFSEISEYPVFTSENEIRTFADDEMGVFIFNHDTPVQNENDIAELFSDRVNVSFTSNNIGVITYLTPSGEKDFTFVRVPPSSKEEVLIERESKSQD